MFLFISNQYKFKTNRQLFYRVLLPVPLLPDCSARGVMPLTRLLNQALVLVLRLEEVTTGGATVIESGASVVEAGVEVVGSGAEEVEAGEEVVGSGAEAVEAGVEVVGSGAEVEEAVAEVVGSGGEVVEAGAEVVGTCVSVVEAGALAFEASSVSGKDSGAADSAVGARCNQRRHAFSKHRPH